MNIENKFNINDTVWFMRRDKPNSMIVGGIDTFTNDSKTSISYRLKSQHQTDSNSLSPSGTDNSTFAEKRLFSTKKKLLESIS